MSKLRKYPNYHTCPKCDEKQFLSAPGLVYARKHNPLCKSCRSVRKSTTRNCPTCGHLITYANERQCRRAELAQRSCVGCGRKQTAIKNKLKPRDEKRCSNCTRVRTLADFHKNRSCPDGRHNLCKICRNDLSKQWRADNPEKSRELGKRGYRSRRVNRPEYIMWTAAKRRARKRTLPFNIAVGDIIIPDVCPVFGIPLKKSLEAYSGNSPSLDQVVAGRGYVKGNIAVISMRANILKRDATLNELEMLVEYCRKQSLNLCIEGG